MIEGKRSNLWHIISFMLVKKRKVHCNMTLTEDPAQLRSSMQIKYICVNPEIDMVSWLDKSLFRLQ